MKKHKKILLVVLCVLALIGVCSGFAFYKIFYAPNVKSLGKNEFLYLKTGVTADNAINLLKEKQVIENETWFNLAAKILKLDKVKPGRYKITDGMSNKSLIRMLTSGRQTPVRITFSGNIRSNEKIASIASKYIEADSASIVAMLNNDAFLQQKYSLDRQTIKEIFIPNTYEIYWNSSAENLLDRMYREYQKFWSGSRTEQLSKINMTRNEVITLASIVAEETNVVDEMPRIAGVYINRLNQNIPLQADPTLKYALGDFSIRRILNVHKEIDSPFNTYMNAGLPPAPICVPSIAAIDAVLNYEKNEYLYFCAKADFSGSHVFAKTLAQHNSNAAAYHAALNNNRIY